MLSDTQIWFSAVAVARFSPEKRLSTARGGGVGVKRWRGGRGKRSRETMKEREGKGKQKEEQENLDPPF